MYAYIVYELMNGLYICTHTVCMYDNILSFYIATAVLYLIPFYMHLPHFI